MGFLDNLWNWITYLFWGRKYKLVFIGLDNAGKTSTLLRLANGRMTTPLPTNMPNMQDVTIGNLSASIFDVGGHELARKLWDNYLVSVDAIIFILDSSDKERLEEAKFELSNVLKGNATTPVLVLANKQDLTRAMREPELRVSLGLEVTSGKKATKADGGRAIELFPCSVLENRGLIEGFTWLSKQV